jgi:DNA-binding transcriptional LysR family regulator
MELRHLRSFLVVAEELHFGRAAKRLGIEQSPLSRQIQDLEADLKVRLFNRTRRATTLTKSGERFIADVRRILGDLDSSIRALRVHTASGEPVRLGLAEGGGGLPFGRLVQLCRSAEPEISVVLSERGLAELVGSILTGGLEAILGPKPVDILDLESVPVWSEQLVLVAPESHAGAGAVWLRSLCGQPWILPDSHALPGSALAIEALLTNKELNERALVSATTPAALVRLVAAGAGIGLLPRSLVHSMDGVAIRSVRDPDAISTTYLTVLETSCPLMKRFRDLVENAGLEFQPAGRP